MSKNNENKKVSRIIRKIIQKINTPLGNVHPFFNSPINQDHVKRCLCKRSIDRFLHYNSCLVNRYYRTIHSWIPANPSKYNVVEALNQIYVYADNPERSIYFANTKIGEKVFFDTIVTQQRFILYLIGPKGIGKTIFLNHFFNNYTEVLELNDRKIVWYRIDASKVYDRWKRQDTADISQWDIKNYLKNQICYVTFNSKKTLAFLDIQNNKNNEFLEILTLLVQQLGGEKTPKEIIDAYIKFIKNFTNGCDPTKNNELFFEHLLNKNLLVDVSILHEAIVEYLNKNDYKILLVFDGIDNVDFLTDYALYKKFITELSLYIKPSNKPSTIYNKVIVALRHPAVTFLKKNYPSFFLDNTIIETEIKPVSPNEMLYKKSIAAKNPAKYFEDSRPTLMTAEYNKQIDKNEVKHKAAFNKFEEYDDELIKYSKDYIEKIRNYLLDIIRKSEELDIVVDKKNIISILFNNNYRAFSLNYINSFKMVNLSKERKRIREEYLLGESLILNGQMYIDTEDDSNAEPNGGFTPNIFWFPKLPSYDKEGSQWDGLCSLRLLQTCWIREYSISQLIEIMKSCFRFRKETTEILIKILTKYGLIDVSYGYYKKGIEQYYKTNVKGKFIYYLTFIDFNCFYYFSLDTPLHDKVLHNSKLVKCHTNHEWGLGELWEGYSEASILTSLTLIRHIKYTHEIDKVNLEDKKAYLYKLGIDIDDYNLPFEKHTSANKKDTTWYEHLLVGMTKQIHSICRQKDRINNFELDVEGIISL